MDDLMMRPLLSLRPFRSPPAARLSALMPALWPALLPALWPALLPALLLAVACTPRMAAAQDLADPTRPPPEARIAGPGQADAAPVRSGPQLQSVLTGDHGRQVAVIDGHAVRPGEKIGGATLVKVGKDHVVLQRGRARQTLKLFPDAGVNNKAVPQH
ncbi:MAG: hypothetical protein ABW069_07415 [Duganella sp.]